MIRIKCKIKTGGVTLFGELNEEKTRGYSTVMFSNISVDDGIQEVPLGLGGEWDAVDEVSGNHINPLPCINAVINFSDVAAAFENVKVLRIGKAVSYIKLDNSLFPNVKTVISESPYFLSGGCLIKSKGKDGKSKLLNTFCKQPGELIDMAGADSIGAGAFDGCISSNIVNEPGCRNISPLAFCGYRPENRKGGLCIGGTLVKADEEADTIYIPEDVLHASDNAFCGIRPGATIVFRSEASLGLTRGTSILCNGETYRAVMDFRDGEFWLNSDNYRDTASNVASANTVGTGWASEIIVLETDKNYKSVDGIVYSKDGKILYKCPEGMSRDIIVPEGVEYIVAGAFINVKSKKITFPGTLRIIDDLAFSGCGFQEIVLPHSVEEVGNANFRSALHIRQEGAIPVKGLLYASIEPSSYAGIRPRDTDHVAIIEIGSEKLILPSAMESDVIDPFCNEWDGGKIPEGLRADDIFKSGQNPALRQDTALVMLTENPENMEARKYLKNAAGKMMDRYIANGLDGMAAKLLHCGLVSMAKIKALLDDPMVSPALHAYLLDASYGKKRPTLKI